MIILFINDTVYEAVEMKMISFEILSDLMYLKHFSGGTTHY